MSLVNLDHYLSLNSLNDILNQTILTAIIKFLISYYLIYLMAQTNILNKVVIVLAIAALVSSSNLREYGCSQRKADNSCLTCLNDFYMNADGICISEQECCLQYMTFNGSCTRFQPTSPQRARLAWPNMPTSVFQQANGLCLLGYFRNQKDMCQRQVPKCIARDRFGRCARCDREYSLKDQKCVIGGSTPVQNQDPYCAQFNAFQQCIKCKPGSSLVRLGLSVDQICAPQGYDKQCQTFVQGQLFGRCKYCNLRWYPDSNGKCQKVSDFCKNYNYENGTCQRCVDDSIPISNQCPRVRVNITNCQQYGNDNRGFFCTQCRSGYEILSPAMYQPLASCVLRGSDNGGLGNSACKQVPPPSYCSPLGWP